MNRFLFWVLVSFSVMVQAQTNYSILDIPSELSKNANSVLLSEKEEIDVSVFGKLNYKKHSVKVILNENGNNDVAAYVSYDKDTKVKKVEAFIYDAFGNEIKHIKKRDFLDVSAADGFSIYNDNRVLYLNYTPTTYPYIVSFSAEYENNTTAHIPTWYPVGGYSRSTKKSEYILTFDPANKPRFFPVNLKGLEIEISESPTKIVCMATNIPAFKYEKLSPSFSEIVPNVSFSLNNFTLVGVKGNAKNWQEFGAWMQQSLLTGVNDIPEATIVKIKNLIKNETTNEAKARIIYDYLQKKVRYISIQIGIGGWKPMLASDVDRLSYGDCKALTNYTKTLLDAVGIPSYYTILFAGDEEKSITKDFSRLQGNHAILGVPDGDKITWLECTSQDKPFGFIGDFCDDRDVLIVTPEGGKIVRTKKYSFYDNLQKSTIVIQINKDGSANASFNSISKGTQYGDKFRIKNKKDQEIKEYYRNRWDNINGFLLNKINLTNNRDSISYKEEIVLTIPKYGSKIGNDYLFTPNIFNKSEYVPPRMDHRKNDLYLSSEFEDVDTVEIEIPNGFEFDALPKNESIENEFGNYEIQFKLISENKLEYTRRFVLKKGTFSKDKYNDYRLFRRKVAKLDKTKLILKTSV